MKISVRRITHFIILTLFIFFFATAADKPEALEESCICHNINNNPKTVCISNKKNLKGHDKHIEKGIDRIGRCIVEPTPEPSPTPTPNPIPSGYKTFSVSGGNGKGPSLRHGFINPYDPDLHQQQTIGIFVAGDLPVESVDIVLITDNERIKYPANLVDGTVYAGTWQATWIMNDSYLFNYHSIIEASDALGTRSVNITLR